MTKFLQFLLIELFYVLTAAIVLFVVFELLWPRIVLAYVNISMLLIFWLIAGILIIVDNKKESNN